MTTDQTSAPKAETAVTNDETANTISPPPSPFPLRVVSLLPSITELIACLGAGDLIVGITHECDYPLSVVQRKIDPPIVVTTSDISPYSMTQEEIHQAVCGSLRQGHSLYGLQRDLLLDLQPNLILTQSLCDVCAVSYPVVKETCAKLILPPDAKNDTTATNLDQRTNFNPQIISLEPSTLYDVFSTLRVAGKALGPVYAERAEVQINHFQKDLQTIQDACQFRKRPRVAFLEWHSPLFCGGHWIADMMNIAGAKYDMCESGKRSYAIEDGALTELNPDCILIGPCGFTLDQSWNDTLKLLYGIGIDESEDEDDAVKQKRFDRVEWWKSLRAVQNNKVFCLDGNGYFARPGPRLVQGTGIIAACIHGTDLPLEERLAPRNAYRQVTTEDLTVK